MNTPVLMGSDVVSHQYYLRQVARLANEKQYSPKEIQLRFPDVEARYTDVHADHMRLQLKGRRVIEGDTLYTYAIDSEGHLKTSFTLEGDFERS